MSTNNLDSLIGNNQTNNEKNIDLGRIALSTLGYGIAGAFYDDVSITAPVSAFLGMTLTTYDEIKQTGMNLTYPALGIFLGGLIGSLFDLNYNETIPNILAYMGSFVGAGLGLFKSYLTRNQT